MCDIAAQEKREKRLLYMREWYKRNRESQLASHKKYYKTSRTFRLKHVLQWVKKFHGCRRCGFNTEPAALEFHHLDRTKKKFTIGRGLCKPTVDIINEIDKCEVLCANCHRIEHHGKER